MREMNSLCLSLCLFHLLSLLLYSFMYVTLDDDDDHDYTAKTLETFKLIHLATYNINLINMSYFMFPF